MVLTHGEWSLDLRTRRATVAGRSVDSTMGFTAVDGLPMGVAGVWARWTDPEDGSELLSYAIITVNAKAHGLMNRYQAQGSEKSMPAILNEGAYDAWLGSTAAKAKEFLRAYPAQKLLANPVEKGRKNPLGI